MALVQYFVCCITQYSFLSVVKKNVWHSIEQRTIDASIDHDLKHACVPKADILTHDES